ATSRAEAATAAPAAASASVRARVRFHTVRGNPAFRRFRPIGRPINPKPMNPTRVAIPCLLAGLFQSRRRESLYLLRAQRAKRGNFAQERRATGREHGAQKIVTEQNQKCGGGQQKCGRELDTGARLLRSDRAATSGEVWRRTKKAPAGRDCVHWRVWRLFGFLPSAGCNCRESPTETSGSCRGACNAPRERWSAPNRRPAARSQAG